MANNKDKNKAGSKSRKAGLGFGGFGLIVGGKWWGKSATNEVSGYSGVFSMVEIQKRR
jgi:hypothetical protein